MIWKKQPPKELEEKAYGVWGGLKMMTLEEGKSF